MQNIARLGTGLSLLFTIPISFSGLREATIDLIVEWNLVEAGTMAFRSSQNALSAFVLFVTTVLAYIVDDPGDVIGLTGAICGAACSFFVPCILYRQAMTQYFVKEQHGAEIFILASMAILGVIVACAGTYANLTMESASTVSVGKPRQGP